ncbi:MAG: indolepyruvate ferredoxin oxidoreductase subunit alpha [Candidatus Aenigmatarchaeota archaeon]
MVEQVLSGKPGEKVVMLGNEAVVRGALEAGVQFASTYPGTPASEIGDTFAKIAKHSGVYFEYSTNEKTAFEAAAGAAMSGLRAIVSFKQFGLNVASDSVGPVAYVGVDGGLVIAFADDPNGWSSAQTEQDSKCYARMMHIPMLEPSDSQECIDFVKAAFDLSEKFKTPVFVRLTTRVDHSRSIVTLGQIVRGERKANFAKDPERYFNLPPRIVGMHDAIAEKMENVRVVFENHDMNRVLNAGAGNELGVITSGAAFNYVMEAMHELGLKLPVLKLGTTYPLPERKIADFISGLKAVLVAEELEPVLEREIEAIAKDANPKLRILGKMARDGRKYLPLAGEYNTEVLLKALASATSKKLDFDYDGHAKKFAAVAAEIPRRFPVFCPGCPHRPTFYAVKRAAGSDAVFAGDIGCYMLGIFPPFDTQDFVFSMGAGEGVAHGIKKANSVTGGQQKVIAFIGDGTFFHAGIPALLNMVFNKSNPVVVVLDNRITAMTGHQPNPGMGVTGMGDPAVEIKIDDIAKACGVKHVKVVDPYNMRELEATVKEFLKLDEVSVIVAKRRCYLLDYRDKRKSGSVPTFEIAGEPTFDEIKKLKGYSCPAHVPDGKGGMAIDESMCWGCASCSQLCKPGTIRPKLKK